MRTGPWVRAIAIGYIAAVTLLLLSPSATPAIEGVSAVGRFATWLGLPGEAGGGAVTEFVLNVAIFVPAPILLLLLWPGLRPVRAVVLPIAAAGLVETVQALLMSERSGSLVDLLANSVGALVGLIVARALRRGISARADRSVPGLLAGGSRGLTLDERGPQ